MNLTRSLLLLVFLLFVSWFPSTCSAQLIVAHRGASHDAPENTLAAFQLAWKQGADAIEGDFYLTADQQIVCSHDKDTQRVCPTHENLTIADTDLATLQSLDVGSWKGPQFAKETMPSLGDVLATVPLGKQIFVEIKSGPEILPILNRELTASKLKPDQIMLLSFKSAVIEQARQLMPQYRANWLTDYRFRGSGEEFSWAPTQEQILATLARTGATGLSSHGHARVVNQPFVTAVVDAGFEFHAWTIDDPVRAAQLKTYGTLSLTTNCPNFLRQQLEPPNGEPPIGEQPNCEQLNGEQTNGEQTDGEQTDGEQTDGEQTDGEQTDGEQTKSSPKLSPED